MAGGPPLCARDATGAAQAARGRLAQGTRAGQAMGSDGVRSSIAVGLAAVLLGVGAPLRAQAKQTGSPERQLPRESAQLTCFGERAAWSPDDKRIPSMARSFG